MPTLTIVFENREVRSFELMDEVITIGRSVENEVEIPDPNMSRRHCRIEKHNGQFILRDLNSSNGTRVNGRKVISHVLSDGDRVECGHSVIGYRTAGPYAPRQPQPPPPGLSTADTIRRRPAPTLPSRHLGPWEPKKGAPAKGAPPGLVPPHLATPAPMGQSGDGVGVTSTSGYESGLSWLEGLDPAARDAETPHRLPAIRPEMLEVVAGDDPSMTSSDERLHRDDFRRLLEVNKAINSELDLRRLLAKIIDEANSLIGAERGFLVLRIKGEFKVEIARGPGQEAIADPEQHVSKSICTDVMASARPLLTTNAAEDQRYGRFASVMGLNLRSILCVPLRIKSKVLGTLYLDNPHEGAFSSRDVEILTAFADQAAIAIDNARLIREAKHKERMDQELKIATEIQQKLLPRELPSLPGLEIDGRMVPAKEVGGDYYDVIVLEDGSLLVAIGDVSGKGVGAGLIMAMARSALRILADLYVSPKDIVARLNRRLYNDLDKDLFMSLLVIHYYPDTGRFVYTGAGHEHLLIYQVSSGKVEARKAGGMVLGLAADIEPRLSETELQLGHGDIVVLYTDGIPELMNRKRDQYTFEKLVEKVEALGSVPPRAMNDGIMKEALEHRGRTPQSDDITLVSMRRV